MNEPAVAAPPDLSGRKARCSYYGRRKSQGSYSSSSCANGRDATVCTCEKPSSTDLAFFRFGGDGSFAAAICKHCGSTPSAHPSGSCPPGGVKRHASGSRYEPQGDTAIDEFYCGCYGWD